MGATSTRLSVDSLLVSDMHVLSHRLALARFLGAIVLTLVTVGKNCASFAQEVGGLRKLAAGVVTVIPPDPLSEEAASGPIPLVEIVTGMKDLDWKPNYPAKTGTVYERSKHVVYHRDIWCLEFAFKPLRMIEVDLPQPSGKVQRKIIWYLVYGVRNVGTELKPTPTGDVAGLKSFKIEVSPGSDRRFFGHFVLQSHDYDKAYLDRIIPIANEAIARREKPGVKLHNSIEISRIPIPISDERNDRSVWGVVTWEDVDPHIDFFSIYVRGLTNAFQFEDTPGGFKAGDSPGTGRIFRSKTLQLNFWRPGDALYTHEEEFRYGVPVDSDPDIQNKLNQTYGLEQRVDHRWLYR